MAWMANSNFLKMCAGAVAYSNTIWRAAPNHAGNRINVYKGTIPSDPNSWSVAGYSSDLLCQFSSGTIVRTSASVTISAFPSPSDVTATGTGTATWFAMYCDTFVSTRWLLGDVSENGGTGALYISTVNVVSGNTISFLNFNITFYGV